MFARSHFLLCHYTTHGMWCHVSLGPAIVLGIIGGVVFVGGMFSILNFFKDI